MKTKMIYVAALVLGAVTVMNVKTVLEANRTYDLAMTSIDALSEDGENSGDGGSVDQESNDEGSGMFFYKHRTGKPDYCTLYRHTHIDGTVQYSESSTSLGANWTRSKVGGLKEKCPKEGNGCTAYSCRQTN